MLTQDGQKWLAGLMADRLQGGAIVVGNGTETAETMIDKIEVVEIKGDGDTSFGVQCEGTFGATEANFEWSRNGVKLADGTEVDADQKDGGRKAAGSAWTIAVLIKVA